MAGSVFVSYSRQDSVYVGRMTERMRQAGLRTWVDTERVQYGDHWELTLREQVDQCAVMVVVMSPAAEASVHVGNELQRARLRAKAVVPVLVSGEAFFALGTTHYFDARDGRLPDALFLDRLLQLAAAGHPPEAKAGPGAVPPLVVGDPPGRPVAWQDRPGTLEELIRTAGASGMAVVCALAGQRGVGKTQIAAAYARLRIQHGWPVVVWADAATEAGLIAALDELATAAGVRERGIDPSGAARAALRWLRGHPGPCLLVYDNAVDADVIRTWSPSLGPVQTVVTTTVRELDSLGEMVDVALFSSDEAVDYLRRRTHVDDAAEAAEVAEALGRLPLALAQAGAVIGPGRRFPSYRRYSQALDRTSTTRLLPRTPGDPYPYRLADAVQLSLDDLAAADLGSSARSLLESLAVVAPTGIDDVLVRQLMAGDADPDREEPPDADEVVAVLAGRSLATVAADSHRILVHRLIQRVVRERCRSIGTLETLIAGAVRAVRVAVGQAGGNWRDRALLVQYAEHARALLANASARTPRAEILELLADLQYLLNDTHSYTASLAIGPVLIAEAGRVHGPHHPLTLSARQNLAYAYQAVGQFDDAIDLHTSTLRDRERILGPSHRDTLISRHNLARAYRRVGRVHEAIELHTRNLADRERSLGPDHPDTLSSRHNLAHAYQEVGRLDEAIELHTATLADRRRLLGPDHQHTLASRHNLACAYKDAGRLNEAIELHIVTLADRERALGSDHPDTLTSRNDLARAYLAVDRVDEAIELFVRALADRERILGSSHPHTVLSREDLADALRAAGL